MMKRLTVLLTVVVLVLLAAAAPVRAGPPVVADYEGWYGECSVETPGGRMSAGFSVGDRGANLFANYEQVGGAFWFGDLELADFDGVHVSGVVPLFAGGEEPEEPNGEEPPGVPVGEAEVSFDIALGESVTHDEQSRHGNHVYRVSGTETELLLSGWMSINGDGPYAFTDCEGRYFDFHRWNTDPTAHVSITVWSDFWLTGVSGEYTVAAGAWSTVEEGTAHVGLGLGEGEEAEWLYEGFIYDEAGEGLIAEGQPIEIPVSGTAGDGVAVLEFTLTPTDTHRLHLRSQDIYRLDFVDMMTVGGSVTFPDGFAVDLATLDGYGNTSWTLELWTYPQGPPVGGPVPTNDAPEGAVALRPGIAVNAHTRGASLEPEVDINYEWGPLPVGRTLWYTFEGTGEPVTVSTSGSDFQTVFGVYTAEAESFEQVAVGFDPCGGQLQAEVTLSTSAGVTYYVQAGGIGYDEVEYGRLRIEIN